MAVSVEGHARGCGFSAKNVGQSPKKFTPDREGESLWRGDRDVMEIPVDPQVLEGQMLYFYL